jgi:hypothetical protein
VTASYLRRNDVGYPQQAGQRGIYGVRYFEAEDPQDLRLAVNNYLAALPKSTNQWVPHLVSTEFIVIPAEGPPQSTPERHCCWLTIFAAGSIAQAPAPNINNFP